MRRLEDRVNLVDDLALAEELPAIIHKAEMGIVPYHNERRDTHETSRIRGAQGPDDRSARISGPVR